MLPILDEKIPFQSTSSALSLVIPQYINALALWTPFPPPLRKEGDVGMSFSTWPRPIIESGTLACFSRCARVLSILNSSLSGPLFPRVVP